MPSRMAATFELVYWNTVAFVEEQGCDEDNAITRVITLTGTGTAAQAAFPTEYLEANWPLLGKYTMKLVKSVVELGKYDRSGSL
jgi:hypothetical protein